MIPGSHTRLRWVQSSRYECFLRRRMGSGEFQTFITCNSHCVFPLLFTLISMLMKNIGKMTLFVASVTAACFTITGCAALFRGSHDVVSFSSDPPGAKVYVDGMEMGKTPMQAPLVAKHDHSVQFRMDGYEATSKVISSSAGGGWIVLDVLGGVIPIVVDAATGAWNGLDDSNVSVILDKKG
jgi:hypothetical protein